MVLASGRRIDPPPGPNPGSQGQIDVPIEFYQFLNNWHNGKYADISPFLTDNFGTHVLVVSYVFDSRGKPIIKNGHYVTRNESLLITTIVSNTVVDETSVFDPNMFDSGVFS